MRYDNVEMNPLLTDLYQITMLNGYFKSNIHEREAVFHLNFRKNPFGGGYSIAAGLDYAMQFIDNLALKEDDKAYLTTLEGVDGKPLFGAAFLDFLEFTTNNFECDIDAVPEGTPVFPHEPLIRVRGPICQCQLLETALLYYVNFATLIATKASRLVEEAKGEPVIEFGLRRAQNGLLASRAAYIGGTSATSNVLAGKLFGIPVKGTHAHSWVMSWNNEQDAFDAYAKAMPNNAILLVDTYDTLQGVRHAIKTGNDLRANGYELGGIRLDSGDLAWLSIEARKLLNEAGFTDAKIVASNDLDETLIHSLKAQGAEIDVWGIGTQLVTGGQQPALGGVYKLAAIRDANGPWIDKIKVSEQTIKTSIPGIQQIRRYQVYNNYVGDVIYEEGLDLTKGCTFVDPQDETKSTSITSFPQGHDLLVPIYRKGECVYETPSLHDIREHKRSQLIRFTPEIKRLMNPHNYKIGLEQGLFDKRKQLIVQARKEAQQKNEKPLTE